MRQKSVIGAKGKKRREDGFGKTRTPWMHLVKTFLVRYLPSAICTVIRSTHQHLAGWLWCSTWRPATPRCPAPAEEERPRCPGWSTWPCLRTAFSGLQQSTAASRWPDSPSVYFSPSSCMWPKYASAKWQRRMRALGCRLESSATTEWVCWQPCRLAGSRQRYSCIWQLCTQQKKKERVQTHTKRCTFKTLGIKDRKKTSQNQVMFTHLFIKYHI